MPLYYRCLRSGCPQDSCFEVRLTFVTKLVCLLAAGSLEPPFHMIPFLTVHDPEREVIETARSFVQFAVRGFPQRAWPTQRSDSGGRTDGDTDTQRSRWSASSFRLYACSICSRTTQTLTRRTRRCARSPSRSSSYPIPLPLLPPQTC